MKMLVVGLGNIGTVYGWALSEAGADVTHVVRKGKKALFEDGVRLDILDMREGREPTCTALYEPKVAPDISPRDGYQLVMVPTREYQLAGALREYAAGAGPDADFLLFAANWDGTDAVDEIIPRSRYVWGYAAASGGALDGVLYVNIREDYRIGKIEGNREDLYQSVLGLFASAGFKPDEKENMVEWLWVHHAINGATIGTALYAGGLAKMGDPEMLKLMVRAAKEAIAVLEARGVDVRKYPDTRLFLDLPEEEAARRFSRSILESPAGRRALKAGHFNTAPDEMKRYYLDVLETGERLGVPMPVMAMMRHRIEGRW